MSTLPENQTVLSYHLKQWVFLQRIKNYCINLVSGSSSSSSTHHHIKLHWYSLRHMDAELSNYVSRKWIHQAERSQVQVILEFDQIIVQSKFHISECIILFCFVKHIWSQYFSYRLCICDMHTHTRARTLTHTWVYTNIHTLTHIYKYTEKQRERGKQTDKQKYLEQKCWFFNYWSHQMIKQSVSI